MKQVLSKAIDILKKIVFVILILVICSIIIGMTQGKHPKFFGYQIFRVLTSSMQPAISESTCIITKEVPQEELEVGDIITFISEDPDIYGYYNTHRIHEIIEENGEIKYVTKGDANPFPDENMVSFDQVTGEMVRELPGGRLIGQLFNWLSDSKIYFLVVMLPMALILLSYIWQIIGYVTHRYDDDDDEEEEEEEEDGESCDENKEDKVKENQKNQENKENQELEIIELD